jgi:hypothetical protein
LVLAQARAGPLTTGWAPRVTAPGTPARRLCAASLRKRGGLIDAPGRGLVGAKGKYPHCPVYLLTLRLYQGTIHSSGDAASDYQTNFETYDVNLDLRENLGGSSTKAPDPKELTLPALVDLLRRQRDAGAVSSVALAELHRRFAIPFACVVFGLVGVPLGIAPARTVRSRGFAISLAVIFAYYILLSAGQGLAEQGTVPAWFGLWAPNLIFGALGALLLREAGRERTLARSVGDLFARLRAAWWPRPRPGGALQ